MQTNATRRVIIGPDYWGRQPDGQPVVLGALHLEPAANRLTIDNIRIFLRPMEFRLLHFLMTHPDEVHTRERLLEQIWGDWIVVGARTVDVHIRRLRSMLQPFGLERLVQTVHCRGYLFSGAASKTTEEIFIN